MTKTIEEDLRDQIIRKQIQDQINKLDFDSFIDFIIPIIDIMIPPCFNAPAKKYSTRDYVSGIIQVLYSNTCWIHYMGLIPGKTLNAKHNEYCKKDIYEEIHKQFLNKYFSKNKSDEIKYQSIDTTSIANKNCNDFVAFDKHKGSRKQIKISAIVGSHGIPLSISPFPGNMNDTITLIESVNKIPINLKTKQNQNNNRHKQYMLADTGYCSKNNRSFLIEQGYIPLIRFNKRNNKNEEYINSMKFSERNAKKYKNRMSVERFFSWIKHYPKINNCYEKTSRSFLGLVLLASCLVINSII
jgi:transposase